MLPWLLKYVRKIAYNKKKKSLTWHNDFAGIYETLLCYWEVARMLAPLFASTHLQHISNLRPILSSPKRVHLFTFARPFVYVYMHIKPAKHTEICNKNTVVEAFIATVACELFFLYANAYYAGASLHKHIYAVVKLVGERFVCKLWTTPSTVYYVIKFLRWALCSSNFSMLRTVWKIWLRFLELCTATTFLSHRPRPGSKELLPLIDEFTSSCKFI